jgi:hypothetical protein
MYNNIDCKVSSTTRLAYRDTPPAHSCRLQNFIPVYLYKVIIEKRTNVLLL